MAAAAATELMHEIRFSGVQENGIPFVAPIEFIRAITDRKTKCGWTEATTMGHVAAALKGPAGEWYHKTIRAVEGQDVFDKVSTNFTDQFLPRFKKRYQVSSAASTIRLIDLSAQGKTEPTDTYLDRIVNALDEYRYVNTGITEIDSSVTPLSAEARAAVPAGALQEQYAAWGLDIQTKAREAAHRAVIGELAKTLLTRDLRDARLREFALEEASKTQPLINFMEAVRVRANQIALLKADSQPNSFTKKGGGKTNNRIAALGDDNENSDNDEELAAAMVAALRAAKSKGKKTNNSNKKERENKKEKGKDKRPVCAYCKKRNHSKSECRSRLADEAAGIHRESVDANETAGISMDSATERCLDLPLNWQGAC